jgi:hypothetical protein
VLLLAVSAGFAWISYTLGQELREIRRVLEHTNQILGLWVVHPDAPQDPERNLGVMLRDIQAASKGKRE